MWQQRTQNIDFKAVFWNFFFFFFNIFAPLAVGSSCFNEISYCCCSWCYCICLCPACFNFVVVHCYCYCCSNFLLSDACLFAIFCFCYLIFFTLFCTCISFLCFFAIASFYCSFTTLFARYLSVGIWHNSPMLPQKKNVFCVRMAASTISAIHTHTHTWILFRLDSDMEIECGSCTENVAHLFGRMLSVVHTRVVKYYEII